MFTVGGYQFTVGGAAFTVGGAAFTAGGAAFTDSQCPFKGSIINKKFFSGIISVIPNFNIDFFLVKGQKWLSYRCFCTQNVTFGDFYELDRNLYELDRNLYKPDRNLYKPDHNFYEPDIFTISVNWIISFYFSLSFVYQQTISIKYLMFTLVFHYFFRYGEGRVKHFSSQLFVRFIQTGM